MLLGIFFAAQSDSSGKRINRDPALLTILGKSEPSSRGAAFGIETHQKGIDGFVARCTRVIGAEFEAYGVVSPLYCGHLPRDDRTSPRVIELSYKVAQLRVEISPVESGKIGRNNCGRKRHDAHYKNKLEKREAALAVRVRVKCRRHRLRRHDRHPRHRRVT